MQAAVDFLVGSLCPGSASMAEAPPPAPIDQESNRRPKTVRLGALPFDQGWMGRNGVSHCLEPSQRKLLTPPQPIPPPPPLLKKEIQF